MDSESQHTHDRPSRSIPERIYRKPPVIEALCEIHFAESTWDGTVPGAFFEQVRAHFPIKRQQETQEAAIEFGPSGSKAGLRSAPRMLFVSEERHRLIQLAENALVINQLQPYPHFEDWEPEIYRAVNIYESLTSPARLSRLGLRYINRVMIPDNLVSLETYFTIYPNLPPGLGDTHGDFVVRVEVPGFDDNHSVLFTFGSASSPDPNREEQFFVLDLYDIVQLDSPLSQIDLRREVRRAHKNIVVAFEDSIKDKLRRLFDPED